MKPTAVDCARISLILADRQKSRMVPTQSVDSVLLNAPGPCYRRRIRFVRTQRSRPTLVGYGHATQICLWVVRRW